MQNKKVWVWTLVIIIAIGVWCFLANTKNKTENELVAQNENQQLLAQNYSNSTAGYEVTYPSNWIVKSKTETSKDSLLEINNMDKAVHEGSDFEMYPNASIIQLRVNGGTQFSAIDDFFKSGLPEQELNRRLAATGEMSIGGRMLRVWHGKGSFDEGYTFIYNGKIYTLTFMSGSSEQYSKDIKIFNDFVASFKLTETQSTSVSAEESSQETFKNQPGEVTDLTVVGTGTWMIGVNLLTRNPDWTPGISGEFFLDQNPKIRNLNINSSTRTYNCGPGPDGNDTTADVLQSNDAFVQTIKGNLNAYSKYYFDIKGSNITAIYSQCLP